MSPNANYLAGRAFEYDTIKAWEAKGYTASRTAGSHGPADVFAFRPDRKPELIQCKRVSTPAEAARIITSFKELTTPSKFYHQVISVKVKGTKVPLEVTV